MTKLFYVVVPYTPGISTQAVTRAVPFFQKQQQTQDSSSSFADDRVQLEQRMSLVMSGLASAGLRAVPLNTEETIELLYRSFNLSELESPIRLTAT